MEILFIKLAGNNSDMKGHSAAWGEYVERRGNYCRLLLGTCVAGLFPGPGADPGVSELYRELESIRDFFGIPQGLYRGVVGELRQARGAKAAKRGTAASRKKYPEGVRLECVLALAGANGTGYENDLKELLFGEGYLEEQDGVVYVRGSSSIRALREARAFLSKKRHG